MMRNRLRFFAITCFFLLAGALPSFGQSALLSQLGSPPTSPTVPIPQGYVNLINGNFHLEFPIESVKQRNGTNLEMKLVYDSFFYYETFEGELGVWNPSEGFIPSGAAAGWSLIVSPAANQLQSSHTVTTCSGGSEPGEGSGPEDTWTNWVYVDANNTAHPFPESVTTQRPNQLTNCGDVPTGTGPASDGSGYYISITNYDFATVYDTHGNIVYTSCTTAVNPNPSLDPGNNASCWIDTNGNKFATWNVVPSEGVIDTSGRNVALPPGFSINTSTIPVGTTFSSNQSLEADFTGSHATLIVISSIVLPDGRQYSFTYDQGSSGHSGVMTGMTLPTGGTVSFSSQMQKSNGLEYGPVPIQSVTTPDGEWGFNINAGGITTVTAPPDPTSHVSSQMTYNLQTQTLSQYAGQATGTPLRSVTTSYGQASEASMYGQNFQPATVTTTLENGQSYKVVFTYQGIPYPTNPNATYAANLIKTKQEYDTSGALIRETDVSYQTASQYLNQHIDDLPLSVTVYGAGGAASTPIAKTTYGYDGTALSATSGSKGNSVLGVATHDDTDYGTTLSIRGNLTGITQMISTSSNVQTVTNYYNILGNLVKSTDGRGNTTNYDYTDSWANNSSCISIASFALPTTITNPLNQQTNTTYNACDGSVHGVQDQNDLNTGRSGTLYSYDGLQRITDKTYPDGGSQTTDYGGSSVPEVVTMTTTATPDPNVVTSTTLDGLGRTVTSEVNSDPAGAVFTNTTYDALGHVYTVTNPYRSGQTGVLALSQGATTYAHDALGRIITQTNPDGSTQSWCYNGVSSGQGGCSAHASSKTTEPWTDHLDETGRHWQYVNDPLGRIVAVMEQNLSSGALTTETDYQYDALNDLTQVDQWGGAINSSGDRQRKFSYDGLSRLISASNPESGTIGYTYDSSSNTQTKTDARGVRILYCYDALNRLISKSSVDTSCPQNGPSSTPFAAFTYDSSSAGNGGGFTSANPIGRLVEASNGSNASEQFSYDPMGRVILQANTLPDGCCTATENEVAAQYDFAGNLTQLTYPDGQVINQHWNGAGEVSQITGSSGYQYLTTNTLYLPDGAPEGIYRGNGVADGNVLNNRSQVVVKNLARVGADGPGTSGENPNFMIHEYCYGPATSALASSIPGCPSLNFKDNGNILQIMDTLNAGNTQLFNYDVLDRVSSFRNGSNSISQTYTTDAWGNMAQGGTANFSAAFASNNRINGSGVGYDADGNVTSFNNGAFNNSYAYDAESKLTSINSGSNTYTYDALGNRIRKYTTGFWTEYVYFGNQPIAEKTNDGTWSDYVYANGERLARIDNYDIRIHMSGTNAPSGSNTNTFAGVTSLSAANGYKIRNGDMLTWRQYQDGSTLGGLYLYFTDNTDALAAQDTDGQLMDQDTTKNSWHVRMVDLSAYAGKTVELIDPFQWTAAPAGAWDIWYGDITLVSTDGTFIPIYSRSMMTLGTTTNLAVNNFQAVTEKVSDSTPLTTTTYYHGDQIGSTRVLTAGTGWPVDSDTYYPYGEESTGVPALSGPGNANHYKFTGKERDSESDLDYFGARYYTSVMGRFMSPDWSPLPAPVPFADLTNPQSLNLYAYLTNSPIFSVDPDGHGCNDDFATGSFSNNGDYIVNGGCLDFASATVAEVGSTTIAVQPQPLPSYQWGRLGLSGAIAPSNGITKAQAACAADVAINYALGFVPGYNAAKLAFTVAGGNVNFVQNLVAGKSIVTFDNPATITDPTKGVFWGANALASTYGAVMKAAASPFNALDDITKVAGTAGTIANLVNTASAAYDLYQCRNAQ